MGLPVEGGGYGAAIVEGGGCGAAIVEGGGCGAAIVEGGGCGAASGGRRVWGCQWREDGVGLP